MAPSQLTLKCGKQGLCCNQAPERRSRRLNAGLGLKAEEAKGTGWPGWRERNQPGKVWNQEAMGWGLGEEEDLVGKGGAAGGEEREEAMGHRQGKTWGGQKYKARAAGRAGHPGTTQLAQ